MAAKTCLEKVGLFKEMGYLHHAPGWATPNKARSVGDDGAGSGRQMLSSGYKQPNSNMDGYFDTKFCRIFTGEAWNNSATIEKLLKKKMKSKGKPISDKNWVPCDGSKNPNGQGTFYGTFSKPIEAFSAQSSAKPLAAKPELPNCRTSPPQKGVGWGYANVALSRYPEHIADPYIAERQMTSQWNRGHSAPMVAGPMKLNCHPSDYFGPNPYAEYRSSGSRSTYMYRQPGRRQLAPFRAPGAAKSNGGHDGCINKFPEYMASKYNPSVTHPKTVRNKTDATFYPAAGPKSLRYPSVAATNVQIGVSARNLATVGTVVYTNLCSDHKQQHQATAPRAPAVQRQVTS